MRALFAPLHLLLASSALGSNFRSWNVKVGQETCLLLQGKISLALSLTAADGSAQDSVTVNVTQPTDERLARCHLATPFGRMIQIGWTLNDTLELSLRFSANASLTKSSGDKAFVLTQVSLSESLNGSLTNGTGEEVTFAKAGLSLTPGFVDRAFLCASGYRHVPIAPNFNISLTNLQVQAFVNRTTYQAQYVCPVDEELTEVVPIVIGGALAASVLLVTLGYLVVTARRTPEPLDIQLPFEEEELKKPPFPATNSDDDAYASVQDPPTNNY